MSKSTSRKHTPVKPPEGLLPEQQAAWALHHGGRALHMVRPSAALIKSMYDGDAAAFNALREQLLADAPDGIIDFSGMTMPHQVVAGMDFARCNLSGTGWHQVAPEALCGVNVVGAYIKQLSGVDARIPAYLPPAFRDQLNFLETGEKSRNR